MGLLRQQSVWCVWTEWGEYEQYSRDMRGCFPTAELAEQHAKQLRAKDAYDTVEVEREPILSAVPESVPHLCWSAHINPDGSEDRQRGYSRGEQFRTWSNEIETATGRLGPWSHRDAPDLFIEVIGCDEEAVVAEYERLLAEARKQLAA